MQPTLTNGSQASTHEMLESLRLAIERLEGESKLQQQEIERLRIERSELRRLLIDQNRHLLVDPKDWEQIDEREYNLTIDDLLAAVRSR